MVYVIYSGDKELMEKLAQRGYIMALNPKTMKYQKVKGVMTVRVADHTNSWPEPFIEGSVWQCVSEVDIWGEAKKKGLRILCG